MKSEIKIPPMGESISEVIVGTIIKESGSPVNIDDEIIEIETDKVNQVLYSPQAGTLTLSVKPQQVVKIGDVIGYVDGEGAGTTPKEEPKKDITEKEDKPQEKSEEKPQEKPVQKEEQVAVEKKAVSSTESENKKAPQPKEEIQKESNIRIQKEDVVAELSKTQEEKPKPSSEQEQATKPAAEQSKNVRETRRPMSRIRKVIAERLVESQRTTAMLTTFNEADMSQVIALREKYKEDFTKHWNVKLGFMSFFVKATVSALKAFPDFNSYLDGEDIVHREYYDIGIAVGSDRGLVVPVVRNCDRLSFSEVETQIESYGKQAKSGGLSADHLKGGGFTITNGGVYGSLLSTPILNPPQCGILGLHKIEKRPVAINDQVVIKPMMYLALSYDHRIVDGKEAVSFLVHIKNVIEDPSRLLLDI